MIPIGRVYCGLNVVVQLVAAGIDSVVLEQEISRPVLYPKSLIKTSVESRRTLSQFNGTKKNIENLRKTNIWTAVMLDIGEALTCLMCI